MSTENLPKQLYEYVNARRNWVGNLEEGLERMRSSGRDFALMLPATKAQYLAARNCDLVAFGHGLVPISYAFAFSASRLSEPVKLIFFFHGIFLNMLNFNLQRKY